MRCRGVLRAVSAAGLAFAGLVGGHAIGYGIAVPDAHHRSTLIADTGHGYLPSVSWAAAVFGLGALAAGIGAGYVRRASNRRQRLGRAAIAMASVQALAFVLVEIFERLAAGASLETLSPTLLLVGIAVQLVIGLVAALVLAGLRNLGSALRTDPRGLVLAPARSAFEPETVRICASATVVANHVRAPPVAAA